MRLIKYRAWLTVKKEMADVLDIEFNRDGTVESICTAESKHKPPCFELLEFTGLLDKNGKEIYESDLVVYADVSGSGRPRIFQPREVRWARDTCNFNVMKPGPSATIEVIGNNHENSDLLKAT